MKIACIPVGEFQANCFIVAAPGNRALVVDPGDDAPGLAAEIERLRLTVAGYLLTHGHVDHISALADLHERFPAPVAIHEREMQWAFDETNCFPPYYRVPRKPSGIARLWKGDEETELAGLACRVIWTPGHSPGSVCYQLPDVNAVFTGDTLFAGSVGRTDLPGGNARDLARSLARLANLPAGVRLYPGHGPETTMEQERSVNFFLQGIG